MENLRTGTPYLVSSETFTDLTGAEIQECCRHSFLPLGSTRTSPTIKLYPVDQVGVCGS